MAGGMNSRAGMTLAERSARSGIGPPVASQPPAVQQDPAPQEVQSQPPGVPSARHCWVIDAPMSPGRWPGVLVQWRRDPARGWQGFAVWVADDDDGPVLLQTWLDAQYLLAGPARPDRIE